ncbi:MAG: hypothetical protein ACXAD7_14660 [Candidatus Kariarchaeaceae archaeon]|jgi:hypothetical protein
MNRIVLKMGFMGTILLLISSIMTVGAADVDTTKLGVSNGDEFTFVIDKSTSLLGDDYTAGWDIDTYEPLYVKEGEEMTMKIINATPAASWWSGGYQIIVELGNGTHTITSEQSLETGEFVTFTDWDYWEANATAEFEMAEAEGLVGSFTIDNGEEEFILKASFDYKDDILGTKSKGSSDIRYEKSTGVLLYKKEKVEASSEALTIRFEDVYYRKGYDVPVSGSGFLPGLEYTIALISISLMLIPIRNRRR